MLSSKVLPEVVFSQSFKFYLFFEFESFFDCDSKLAVLINREIIEELIIEDPFQKYKSKFITSISYKSIGVTSFLLNYFIDDEIPLNAFSYDGYGVYDKDCHFSFFIQQSKELVLLGTSSVNMVECFQKEALTFESLKNVYKSSSHISFESQVDEEINVLKKNYNI